MQIILWRAFKQLRIKKIIWYFLLEDIAKYFPFFFNLNVDMINVNFKTTRQAAAVFHSIKWHSALDSKIVSMKLYHSIFKFSFERRFHSYNIAIWPLPCEPLRMQFLIIPTVYVLLSTQLAVRFFLYEQWSILSVLPQLQFSVAEYCE